MSLESRSESLEPIRHKLRQEQTLECPHCGGRLTNFYQQELENAVQEVRPFIKWAVAIIDKRSLTLSEGVEIELMKQWLERNP